MKHSAASILAAPLRRDLIAILGYVNRSARSERCVDGSFDKPEVHLNHLASAARMQ